MDIRIEASTLRGKVTAPPSKSYAHRLLIASALWETECGIRGIEDSEDILATKDCIAALGSGGVFRCRESGSTLRFFVPLSLTFSDYAEFTGSGRLLERGISEYERIFPEMGIIIEKTESSIRLFGRLRSGDYVLRGDVSSQFVSGLLMALPLCEGESKVKVLPPVESRGYIDITLNVLKKFGVKVTESERNLFIIPGLQKYRGGNFAVESDWSNASVLYALRYSGADIDIEGLNASSIQGDRVCLEYFEKLRAEPATLDVSDCPDLAPVLMAFAALNQGGTLIGTRRLSLKESNRARVMAEELAKFGGNVKVNDNSVDIMRTTLHRPKEKLSGHGDHRIIMALTVLCTEFGGTIRGAEAVNKSWREFFSKMREIGLRADGI